MLLDVMSTDPAYLGLEGLDLDEGNLYPPPKRVRDKAYVKSLAEYHTMYTKSIEDPVGLGDVWVRG